MASATDISARIINATLAEQLQPGVRLREQELATLFGCSRTIVREALIELCARGVVTVGERRGWFIKDVTLDQARELYDSRLIIETGLLRHYAASQGRLSEEAVARLQHSLSQQRASLEEADVGRRSYLLGTFHVELAECLSNRHLARCLQDLTVQTTLFTMRHQTQGDAHDSYEDHAAIVALLVRGDLDGAEEQMRQHLGGWESKVHLDGAADPLDSLRKALAPVGGEGAQSQSKGKGA